MTLLVREETFYERTVMSKAGRAGICSVRGGVGHKMGDQRLGFRRTKQRR